MDKKKKLEGIANAIPKKCRGNDINDKSVLPRWRKEEIIVKVYRDGHSIPLCKYISGDSDNKCSAPSNTKNHGYCPYRSFI